MARQSEIWTEARVALLQRLQREGVPCAQIAAALGPGITRSAVLGKIHRLRRTKPAARRRAAEARPAALGVARPLLIAARRARRQSPADARGAAALAQFNAAIPADQRRTLLQLTRSTCRWPVGEPAEPGFFFCGGRAQAGRPYCAGHCAFAYQEESHPCRPVSSGRPGRRPTVDSAVAPSRSNMVRGPRS
jgi:GcrA cell cycle regulator